MTVIWMVFLTIIGIVVAFFVGAIISHDSNVNHVPWKRKFERISYVTIGSLLFVWACWGLLHILTPFWWMPAILPCLMLNFVSKLKGAA